MGIDRTKNLSGWLYPKMTLGGEGGSTGIRKRERPDNVNPAPNKDQAEAHQLENLHLDRAYKNSVENRIARQIRLDETAGAALRTLGQLGLEALTDHLADEFLRMRHDEPALTWKEFREALLRNFKPEQTGLDRSEFELATGAVHARIEMILASERFGTEIPDLGGSSNAE